MKRFRVGGVFGAVCVVVVMVAAELGVAQVPATAPADRRLDEIEKQIRSLQDLVKDLRAPATQRAVATAPSTSPVGDDPVSRIRDEGMNRSQVMATLSYLTDVIGPRLTGSPNLKRANEWTRDRMAGWGMANAQVEPWGTFGRGWSLKRFSAQVIEPQAIPLTAWPKAWTPGFDKPVSGEVVHLEAATEGELEKHKGKLKGKIVLFGATREVQARFEAPAVRVTDESLLQMANSDGSGGRTPPGLARGQTAAERRAAFSGRLAGARGATTGPTTGPTSAPTTGPGRPVSSGRVLAFLLKEGAAVLVTPSYQGDGGTLFVSAATVPDLDQPTTRTSTTRTSSTRASTGPSTRPAYADRPWAPDAPAMPAQVALAIEDYNRLVRMMKQGEKLKMEVDLRVAFHNEDLQAYNTVAEIPGSDLADELVMIGAHMDSWHSGTGATDNATGVAATMEAVRILQALNLKPRRTIRIGLWTGEEQGLLGSRAYVAKHFGSYAEEPGAATRPTSGPSTRPSRGGRFGGGGRGGATSQPSRRLDKKPGYDRFSVYFNLDNGTGKIRGVYMQRNEAARPIFRRWLAPFADLGAQTLTLNTTGGTDHQSFDGIGLPGFQFIQDPIEYWSRTHHSNADVYDRAQAEDLKQASTIMAAFLWQAATMDDRFPRVGDAEEEARRRPGRIADSAPDRGPNQN
jgi:hypothetical protein